ncbi:MAG: hypothetical protein ACRDX8_06810, partial [Acidimicrobiales bacterium]
MSDQGPGIVELDQAREALGQIKALTEEGRAAFDASGDRRLALAFLWVNVGSALKQFCRLRGIAQGSSPFPGPVGMRDRLCYQRVDDLSARILWGPPGRGGLGSPGVRFHFAHGDSVAELCPPDARGTVGQD